MNFADLLALPGVEEVCELRSRFGFMAFHGGALEAMTDVIARAAADAADASYYGVHHPPDVPHLSSHAVDPEHSPTLAAFLTHVDVVITVHGYGRAGHWASLLVGGGNRELADHVGDHLRRRLPAYDVRTDLDDIPRELRGLHPDNPVNRPRGAGAQIELPPRVRGSSPMWWDWEGPGPTPHTQSLIDALAAAARTWPPRSDAT